jgi:alpha-ribazole phosphatase
MEPNKKTVLLFVRHGQTEANLNELICGDSDSPLTELGEMQIARLAEAMRGVEFDVAYTSSLHRAQRTCQKILEGRNIAPVVLPSLREQDFGDWEGASYKQIVNDDPDSFASFKIDPISARAPGGETLLQFVDRIQSAVFDEMIARNRGKRILCVAHGGTIRAALSLLLNLDIQEHFYRFDIQNAMLTIVRWGDNEGRLVGVNLLDATHVRI